MARIVGVDIPNNKRIEIALTYIYGIGKSIANKILSDSGIDPNIRVKDLSDEDISKLRSSIVNNVIIEGDLRREISLNIKRLKEINCYKGMRHRKGLPVRGQNTKNNSRTRKGPKKSAITKKKVTKGEK